MTRETWGAAKFVMNQPRMIADNKWDPHEEPEMTVDGQPRPWTIGFTGIDNKTFMNMVRPAFPEKCLDTDIEAICTPDYIDALPAGLDDKVTISRHEHRGSYITAKANELLERSTDDGGKTRRSSVRRLDPTRVAVHRRPTHRA